ncbi:MAG: hypothetical protein DI562_03485 [Stenotrophomonas acidaminiphila]|nr:MAG: hypothetical protein DI562_03485 [Stenotrophomonas acidaminiphila]
MQRVRAPDGDGEGGKSVTDERIPISASSLAKFIAMLSAPYGFAIAAFYLFAFWSKVGINPYQHASAAELLGTAIGSLTLLGVFSVFGVIIGLWLGQKTPNLSEKSLKYLPFLFAASLIVAIGLWVWLLVIGNPLHWILLGLGLNFFTVLVLAQSTWLKRWLPEPSLVLVFALLLAYIPCAVTYYGKSEVTTLTSEEKGLHVDLALSEIGADVPAPALYVGQVGGTNVLYSPQARLTTLVPKDRRIAYRTPMTVQVKQTVPSTRAAP